MPICLQTRPRRKHRDMKTVWVRSGAVSQLFFKHYYVVDAMYHFIKAAIFWKEWNKRSTKNSKHIQSCPGHPQGLKSHIPQGRWGWDLNDVSCCETENTSIVCWWQPLDDINTWHKMGETASKILQLTCLRYAGTVVSILHILNMQAHLNLTTLLRLVLLSLLFYW